MATNKNKHDTTPPFPVESGVLPATTVTLPLPAVPVLQRALVLWATNNGLQRDLPAALIARQLCEAVCFFCGKGEGNPSMAAGVPWEEVEVCGCLPLEDVYLEPDWGGAPLSEGYTEVLPGWQDRQGELAEKAGMRQLDARRDVYRNVCVRCEEEFAVSVGVVAASIDRHGAHAVMNRCKPCRDAAVARKGARPQNKKSDAAQMKETA